MSRLVDIRVGYTRRVNDYDPTAAGYRRGACQQIRRLTVATDVEPDALAAAGWAEAVWLASRTPAAELHPEWGAAEPWAAARAIAEEMAGAAAQAFPRLQVGDTVTVGGEVWARTRHRFAWVGWDWPESMSIGDAQDLHHRLRRTATAVTEPTLGYAEAALGMVLDAHTPRTYLPGAAGCRSCHRPDGSRVLYACETVRRVADALRVPLPATPQWTAKPEREACTAGADCTVHPWIQQQHNPNVAWSRP